MSEGGSKWYQQKSKAKVRARPCFFRGSNRVTGRFCTAAPIRESALSRYMDVRNVSIDNVDRLAIALGVDPQDLLAAS